jgi:hypothetical protein
MSDKISIRFFDNREVRAIWDDTQSKWWFSVLDIVAVLTDQDDYTKARNYWKYLKAKLKKENSQVVSKTTQLKLLASDGKIDTESLQSHKKSLSTKKPHHAIFHNLYPMSRIGSQKRDRENRRNRSTRLRSWNTL